MFYYCVAIPLLCVSSIYSDRFRLKVLSIRLAYNFVERNLVSWFLDYPFLRFSFGFINVFLNNIDYL